MGKGVFFHFSLILTFALMAFQVGCIKPTMPGIDQLFSTNPPGPENPNPPGNDDDDDDNNSPPPGDDSNDNPNNQFGVASITSSTGSCEILSGRDGCATFLEWKSENVPATHPVVQIRMLLPDSPTIRGTRFGCSPANVDQPDIRGAAFNSTWGVTSAYTGDWIPEEGATFKLTAAPDCGAEENIKTIARLEVSANRVNRTPPNFVVILMDDLAHLDMVELLKVQHNSPILRQLKEKGITFERFSTTTSICCPSRASLLSGRYTHNHKVWSNAYGWRQFYEIENNLLPVWLSKVGYTNFFSGAKYLNGYKKDPSTYYASEEDNGNPPEKPRPIPGPQTMVPYIPPGWTTWKKYAGFVNLEPYGIDQLPPASELTGIQVIEDLLASPKFPGGDYSSVYTTDFVKRDSHEFLTQSELPEPFYMYLNVVAPHVGEHTAFDTMPIPAFRHLSGRFDGIEVPKPLSFNESDVSDKVFFSSFPLMTSHTGTSFPPRGTIQFEDKLFEYRLKSMRAVEDLLASVVADLESNGILNRTYIFFLSDNGFHQGLHREPSMKSRPIEEDIFAPFLMRGPGVESDVSLPHFVLNSDIPVTIADLAGAPIPRMVDGKSFAPLLNSSRPSQANWRKRFLFEGDIYSGVREERFKYIDYLKHGLDQLAPGERTKPENLRGSELYDIQSDPLELQSIFEQESQEAEIIRLKEILERLQNCQGQECRDIELE